MKYFLDPYKITVQKKLIIESKNGTDKKQYTLVDFGGAYGNNHEICSYLVVLQNDGCIKLEDILIDEQYILAKEDKFKGYKSPTPDEVKAQSRKKTNFYGLGTDTFQSVINRHPLSIDQLQKIFDSESVNDILNQLSFNVTYSEGGIRRLEKELNEYIELYIQGDVVAHGSRSYLSYQNQQAAFKRTIGRLAKQYGAKNLILDEKQIWIEIAKPGSESHKNQLEQARFLETLLAMEHENLIEIVDVIRENEVRVTITANEVPALNDWNRDFHNIADSASYFEFIKNKAETSRKGVVANSDKQPTQAKQEQIDITHVEQKQENNSHEEKNISQLPRALNKRERKQELNNIIKIKKFGKKQAAFLLALVDLEPMGIKELTNKIGTKDCKHLKGAVDEKLKGTNWSIETTRGGGFKPSFYQLRQLPS